MKTLLGWCISGNTLTGKPSNQIISHFISTSTIEEDVNKLWKLENEGLDGYGNTWSQEDKQVISMWDREVQYEDGHFVLPIPWKNHNEPLPNNFVIARSRLDSLVKTLKSNNLMYDPLGLVGPMIRLENFYSRKEPGAKYIGMKLYHRI